jgi:activating signal cointegrator 1
MQPWATLIALGEKRFETRSWNTKYRGELAIHASKKMDRAACKTTPIIRALNKHGIVLFDDLPVGQIIATCRLSNGFKVTDNLGLAAVLDNRELIEGNEYYLGDYSEGRFAWELTDIKVLNEPIHVKGQLGLWNHPKLGG